MSLVRYEPFNYLTQLQDEINQIFKRSASGEESNVATSSWMPAVDIHEDEQKFTIEADIPGVKPEDIEVTMERGILSIRGERSDVKEEEKEGYRRVERARGSFYRRFSLPDTADEARIEAHGKDGVLQIVIPKREVAKPRKIQING
jgi:HSP20 family protein